MRFLLLIFCLITFSFANTHKILFISSYNNSFPTLPKQIKGIKSELNEQNYQLDIEYMDTKRVAYKQIEPLFYKKLILKKHLIEKYDAILIGDDNALKFAYKYQDKFFKNKPIVFFAINNEAFAKEVSKNRFITGVIEKPSIKETINIIEKLHPNYLEPIVLIDETTTSKAILKSFTKQQITKLQFLSLKNYTFDQLKTKLQTLPTNQSILYISALLDKNNQRKEFYEAIEFLSKNTNRPIYHLYEHGIGQGLIGGKVVLFSRQGKLAAQIIKRALSSESIENIALYENSPNSFMFDYNELKKYALNDKLPDDTILINKPEPFFEQNSKSVLGEAILILSVVIFIMIYLLISKNRSSVQVKVLNDELKNKIKEQKTFLSLFENGDAVLFKWINNDSWSVDSVSSNVKNLTGYSKKEFLSKKINYLECIHKDDLAMVQEDVNKGKFNSNGFFKHRPYRIITKNGTIKCVLDYTVIQKNENDQITHFIGYIADITDIVNLKDEIQLFKNIVETTDTGIAVADCKKTDMPLIYVNNAFEKITGYSKEFVLNKNCRFLQGKDKNQIGIKKIKDAIENKNSVEVELKNYKKDGSLFWNLLTLTPIFDKNHELTYYVGVQHDITSNKKLFEKFQQLLDFQDNIVILSDGKQLTYANKKFFDFFHYSTLEEFIENHPCICDLFLHNDRFFHLGKIPENKNWLEEISKLPDNKKIVAMLGKDLEIYAFNIHINKFSKNLYILTFGDISKTVLDTISLEEKTIHDKLTNAYNREYFDQNYNVIINDFYKNNTSLGLALLDIDHFKNVNDSFGHDVGDDVLVEFVNTIKKHSREKDLLIRWGGEEFILILAVNSENDPKKALEHLRQTIQIHTFPIVDKLTCSIGATIYKDDESIEKTIKRADEAVYTAKNNGRNKVQINH